MYVLDTDVVSAAMRPDVPTSLVRRLARVPQEEQVTTAVTLAELVYGAAKRRSERQATAIRELVTTRMRVLPFDAPAAQLYGALRADLEQQGRPLAPPDLQIASIALSKGLPVVTGNVLHFERIPGLRVENWLAPT